MSFEIEVQGRADRSLGLLLGDVVDPGSIHVAESSTLVAVADQAALVSVIAYLNDVGLRIDAVRRVRPPEAAVVVDS